MNDHHFKNNINGIYWVSSSKSLAALSSAEGLRGPPRCHHKWCLT